MKFLIKLMVFLGVVVGLLLWLRNWQAKQPPPAAAASATSVTMPAPVPSQATAPAPAPTLPTNARSKVARVAQRAGVRVASWQDAGSDAIVKVEWVGSSAGPGGDFLDAGLREGAFRDFDDMGNKYGYDAQGRQVWSATYRLKF